METVRTISCKLRVSPEQAAHIDTTLEAFADACNLVGAWGRQHKVSQKFRLQKTCYQAIRSTYGLSANAAVRAIARAATVLTNRSVRHQTFTPTSMDFDARIFAFYPKDWTVSLRLLHSREGIPLQVGRFQREALEGQQPTSATLCKQRKGYYLNIQVKEKAPDPPEHAAGVLGVDLGIQKIATLSDGTTYQSASLNAYRLLRHKVRTSLQSKAANRPKARKGCRRVLKQLSGKERRFQQWVNHNLSKHIVEQAQALKFDIALEDLKGIRQRTNKRLRRSQRGLHNSWAFYQLRQFIEYKARRAGVRVIVVNPAYTSKMCSQCQHVGIRSGERFRCANCGYVADADVNAARNIAAVGGSVNSPGYPLPAAAG